MTKTPKANSRQKGASFERTVAKELFAQTGITFKRDLRQYQESDHGDLTADSAEWPFMIECKAYASGADCRPAWIAQAFTAAKQTGQHPTVIYKFNNKPIRARIWMDAIAEAHGGTAVCSEWMETDLQGLAYIARGIMARRAA